MTTILSKHDLDDFAKKRPPIDPDKLRKLIDREEKNLTSMYRTFSGAHTLCRLQLKLVNALSQLLKSIDNPNTTSLELMHQLSKISALYRQIDRALARAQRHLHHMHLEMRARERKVQEDILLADLVAEEARKKLIANKLKFHFLDYQHHIAQLLAKLLKKSMKIKPDYYVKTLLRQLCMKLGFDVFDNDYGLYLNHKPIVPGFVNYTRNTFMRLQQLANTFNNPDADLTLLEERINHFNPQQRPPRNIW